MSFDHINIYVPTETHKACVDFYAAALKPIGVSKLMALGPNESVVGFGTKQAQWWISANTDEPGAKYASIHVAFSADDRKSVDAFHAAGLAAGGQDNGAPGVRTVYHENYYGAYLVDPAGNNAEVVCHKPE